MIEDFIVMCFVLLPFALAFIAASVMVETASYFIEKKQKREQREKRSKERHAQAEAYTHEMNKIYTQVIFDRIMKGI